MTIRVCGPNRILPVIMIIVLVRRNSKRECTDIHKEQLRALNQHLIRLHVFDSTQEPDDVEGGDIHGVAWWAANVNVPSLGESRNVSFLFRVAEQIACEYGQ